MVTLNGTVAEFRFFRPSARQVYLAGDFNSWRPNQLAMKRTASGYWVAQVHLPPGTFKFRYLADGEWFADYAAFGIEHGLFGFDGVVRVPRQPVAMIPTQPLQLQQSA